MKQAKIDLHIDELILHNLPYTQRSLIAASVEQELMRLLNERGLPPSLVHGRNIPYISVSNIPAVADAKGKASGVQIAETTYGNLSENNSQS